MIKEKKRKEKRKYERGREEEGPSVLEKEREGEKKRDRVY